LTIPRGKASGLGVFPRRGLTAYVEAGRELCDDWAVTSRSLRVFSVLAVGAAVVACKGASRDHVPVPSAVEPGASSASPAPPPPIPSSAPEDDFPGSVGIAEVSRQGRPVKLVGVRWARHPTFDRVVFEYDDSVPGYHVEYIDRPIRQCGSGDTTPVAGDAWLLVKTSPADAHTEAGRPTIPWREQNAELGVLREIERICDFEAEVAHVLGVASPNRYRVLELAAPPRLVVDVRH
jgi:hypothetical protein